MGNKRYYKLDITLKGKHMTNTTQYENHKRGRVYAALLVAFPDIKRERDGSIDLKSICQLAEMRYDNLSYCIRTQRLTWKVAKALRDLEARLSETAEVKTLTFGLLGWLMLPNQL